MDLLQHLHTFLQHRLLTGRDSLLLAFSGGPDSLALLHLMLEYKKTASSPFSLSLAHVDHGWRQESQAEARQIASMAESLGLPLHLMTLDPALLKGNLESQCREERYKFFSSLCQTYGCRAVLLAHHADDQAETVFKRILEGASLSCLSCMAPESEVYGVHAWRPLLGVRKAELEEWLKKRGLEAFDDCTNRDPRFLRGKLRTRIFPALQKEFGKEVQGSLCFLGKEAAEFKEYLDKKIEPSMEQVVEGKMGIYFDLIPHCNTPVIELRHMIRSFCRREGLNPGREQLERCIKLLLLGVADKRLEIESRNVYIDRKRLFIQRASLTPLPNEGMELTAGQSVQFGSWKIEVDAVEEKAKASSTSWEAVWQGYAEAVLPNRKYQISKASSSIAYPRSSPLGKWWTDNKIPAFLRLSVPIISAEEGMRHEFLTGRMGPWHESRKSNNEQVKIRFSLTC